MKKQYSKPQLEEIDISIETPVCGYGSGDNGSVPTIEPTKVPVLPPCTGGDELE